MYSREHDKAASVIFSVGVGGNFALRDELPSIGDESSVRVDETQRRHHHRVTTLAPLTPQPVTSRAEMHNMRAETAVSYV